MLLSIAVVHRPVARIPRRRLRQHAREDAHRHNQLFPLGDRERREAAAHVLLGALLDAAQGSAALRREPHHRLTPVVLVDPAFQPAAPHQHVDRFGDRRQADRLVTRQAAHRARPHGDLHQRAHLRRRHGAGLAAHVGRHCAHHQHHHVQQLARGRASIHRRHLPASLSLDMVCRANYSVCLANYLPH
jgi:hypothetical protein